MSRDAFVVVIRYRKEPNALTTASHASFPINMPNTSPTSYEAYTCDLPEVSM
jgi:hypothetical protein